MRKLALVLPLLALAAAGCATEQPAVATGPVTTGSGGVVTSPGAAPSRPVVVAPGTPVVARPAGAAQAVATLRTGTGVVESVTAVPFMGSATAGASAPGSASRLAIRMGDNTIQYVDYEGRDITVGSRIELTSDGYIRRL